MTPPPPSWTTPSCSVPSRCAARWPPRRRSASGRSAGLHTSRTSRRGWAGSWTASSSRPPPCAATAPTSRTSPSTPRRGCTSRSPALSS
uniref:Uncharacterized protein n=1 Tax=Arundo donax TaxID=35708 RepID=A0A0A9HKE0_ARUDO